MEALALSVETWLTIGYGLQDPYFSACTEGVVIVSLQDAMSNYSGYYTIIVL